MALWRINARLQHINRQGCLGHQPMRECSHATGLLGCTSWLMSRHFLRAHQELSALWDPSANTVLLHTTSCAKTHVAYPWCWFWLIATTCVLSRAHAEQPDLLTSYSSLPPATLSTSTSGRGERD